MTNELESLSENLSKTIQRFGPHSPRVASLYMKIGMFHQSHKDYYKALDSFRKALSIRSSTSEESSLGVANVHHNIGVTILKLCEYERLVPSAGHENDDENTNEEDAIHHLSKALRGRISRASHIDVADTYHYLGWAYGNIGKFDAAMQCLSNALKLRGVILGSEDILVSHTQHRIGMVYMYQGEYQSAIREFHQAMNIRRNVLGNNHFDVAEIFHSLGQVYMQMKQHEKALAMSQQALSIQKNQLGSEDYFIVANTLFTIGVIHCQMSQFDKVIRSFSEVLRLRRIQTQQQQRREDDDQDIIAVLDVMGQTQYQNKDFHSALELYREVLRIKKAVLGSNHRSLQDTMIRMGRAHCQLNQQDLALESFQSAFRSSSSITENNSSNIITMLNKIGTMHFHAGEYDDAMEVFQEALVFSTFSCFNDYAELLLTLTHIANLRWMQQEYELAILAFCEAQHIARDLVHDGRTVLQNFVSRDTFLGIQERMREMEEWTTQQEQNTSEEIGEYDRSTMNTRMNHDRVMEHHGPIEQALNTNDPNGHINNSQSRFGNEEVTWLLTEFIRTLRNLINYLNSSSNQRDDDDGVTHDATSTVFRDSSSFENYPVPQRRFIDDNDDSIVLRNTPDLRMNRNWRNALDVYGEREHEEEETYSRARQNDGYETRELSNSHISVVGTRLDGSLSSSASGGVRYRDQEYREVFHGNHFPAARRIVDSSDGFNDQLITGVSTGDQSTPGSRLWLNNDWNDHRDDRDHRGDRDHRDYYYNDRDRSYHINVQSDVHRNEFEFRSSTFQEARRADDSSFGPLREKKAQFDKSERTTSKTITKSKTKQNARNNDAITARNCRASVSFQLRTTSTYRSLFHVLVMLCTIACVMSTNTETGFGIISVKHLMQRPSIIRSFGDADIRIETNKLSAVNHVGSANITLSYVNLNKQKSIRSDSKMENECGRFFVDCLCGDDYFHVSSSHYFISRVTPTSDGTMKHLPSNTPAYTKSCCVKNHTSVVKTGIGGNWRMITNVEGSLDDESLEMGRKTPSKSFLVVPRIESENKHIQAKRSPLRVVPLQMVTSFCRGQRTSLSRWRVKSYALHQVFIQHPSKRRIHSALSCR